MEGYVWLLVVAGGTLLLGAALVYGVVRQRPLSPSEKIRQDREVRKLYGQEGHDRGSSATDGADRANTRIWPLVLAVVFILLGSALGYWVANQSAAPSASVEGKEQPNAQPAGPADESALPGQ